MTHEEFGKLLKRKKIKIDKAIQDIEESSQRFNAKFRKIIAAL